MENRKYETIKDVLQELVKNYKVEVFGGRNNINKGSFAPGVKEEQWFEVLGLSRKDDCAGGAGLIIRKKGTKGRNKYAVGWFNKVRINPRKWENLKED